MAHINFEFSDTIAGYVTEFDFQNSVFGMKTSDGREFKVRLSSSTYAELVRNLGDSYVDCTGQMRNMLAPGRFLYAYGVFYPDDDRALEAEHVIFVGRGENEFVFERQDWWIKQIQQLANFYLKAQFGDDEIDYAGYSTMLDLYGHKMSNKRQETDTISRLVYGFASAYLLTGDERCLEAAEKGTNYLREHFRAVDASENICYWYHAVDFSGKTGRKILGSNMPEITGMRGGQMKTVRERKLFASEFGDDYDAIPAYEQIYALAGPTQTYRITGDPLIRKDIDRTLNLFEALPRLNWGPLHTSTRSCSIRKPSRWGTIARKNWNSVGDHAPHLSTCSWPRGKRRTSTCWWTPQHHHRASRTTNTAPSCRRSSTRTGVMTKNGAGSRTGAWWGTTSRSRGTCCASTTSTRTSATRNSPGKSPSSCPCTAATRSAAAGTTWSTGS
jgi:hypothetical protein